MELPTFMFAAPSPSKPLNLSFRILSQTPTTDFLTVQPLPKCLGLRVQKVRVGLDLRTAPLNASPSSLMGDAF